MKPDGPGLSQSVRGRSRPGARHNPMRETPGTPAVGCLLCLIQASESMREAIFEGPFPSKLDAVLDTVDQLLDKLVSLASTASPGSPSIEVGVLAYKTGADGKPRIRMVLPGSSASRPFVPYEELASLDPGTTPEGPGRWVWARASGAPRRLARDVSRAGRLAARWASDHPDAFSPILVHLTDGESTEGPLDDVARTLTEGRPATFLVHCLFREGLPASTFTRVPPTPSGDLWSMSSPFSDDPTPGVLPDRNPSRALLVNTRSAFLRIGEIVGRLWRIRLATPSAAPAPIEPTEPTSATALVEQEPPAREPTPEREPEAPECPPRFEARALWTPKRGNTEAQWEDGYAFNPPEGLVAVADGAGSGIFSKLWADLLLKSYLAHPVSLDNPDAVGPWINEQRNAWATRVDYPRQRWSVQLRLDQTCGAATFLGLEIGFEPEGPEGGTPWEAGAVGDVCLLHVREGHLVDSFPISRAADFNATPSIFQSKAMGPMPSGVVRSGMILPGDFLIIATDALAQSLLTEVEAGIFPDWGRFWDIDQEFWRIEIEAARDRGAIVNDDCTLVLVRLPQDSTLNPTTSEDTFSEERVTLHPESDGPPLKSGTVMGLSHEESVEPELPPIDAEIALAERATTVNSNRDLNPSWNLRRRRTRSRIGLSALRAALPNRRENNVPEMRGGLFRRSGRRRSCRNGRYLPAVHSAGSHPGKLHGTARFIGKLANPNSNHERVLINL